MPVLTQADTTGAANKQEPDQITAPRTKRKGGKHPKPTASHLDINPQLLDAVRHEKPRVVRRLLESKANPNTYNSMNETPLMLACGIRNDEARGAIIKLLLKKGADVNLQDRSGQTALMKAVLQTDHETAATLLANSPDVRLEDSDGNNVLCHAALKGDEEIVQTIVEEFKRRKIDVDAKNHHGLTPLLIACQEGHLGSARVLVLEGGASPTIRDLDNFMTAGEWMKLGSFGYSSPELMFLSPSTQKRNYYRRQRQIRGIRTLMDFTPMSPEESRYEANVFTFPKKQKGTGVFPQISSTTESDASASLGRSMFDLPSVSSKQTYSMRKPVPVQQASRPEIGFSTVKTDLYHSSYLSKRQTYLSRNHRSNYYGRGSLEPLHFNAQERLRELQSQSKAEQEGPVRHHTLPPLKRQGSRSM